MSETIHEEKETIRNEAKRVRASLSLDADEYEKFSELFLKTVSFKKGDIIGAYWPKGREFDVRFLLEELLGQVPKVALPVMVKGSKVLKFVQWDEKTTLVQGAYGIMQPEIGDDTVYLEPDIFIVPMLAFDRQGNRMGYGGGYYDSTLEYYAQDKDILCVGVAYAKQACLFNLPVEEHDRKMDYIITQQDVLGFKE